jgi:hypothetical protein
MVDGFTAYWSPLKSLDYTTWVKLQAKANTLDHPKIGSLEQTIWQLLSAKVGQCWGKTATRAGCAWRKLSPLAVALVLSSQASVLEHHLKLFRGLEL